MIAEKRYRELGRQRKRAIKCWAYDDACSSPLKHVDRKRPNEFEKKIDWTKKPFRPPNGTNHKSKPKAKRVYDVSTISNVHVTGRLFNEFATKWKKETGHYSTMIHITRNENYLKVIALGKPAVPFILKDLEKEPDYWFEALKLLTDNNPVPKSHLGNLELMAFDWIAWGKKERLI